MQTALGPHSSARQLWHPVMCRRAGQAAAVRLQQAAWCCQLGQQQRLWLPLLLSPCRLTVQGPAQLAVVLTALLLSRGAPTGVQLPQQGQLQTRRLQQL